MQILFRGVFRREKLSVCKIHSWLVIQDFYLPSTELCAFFLKIQASSTFHVISRCFPSKEVKCLKNQSSDGELKIFHCKG